MQNLRVEIEAQLARHLTEDPFWKIWALESPGSYDAVRCCILSPGKRLRPILFCLACRVFGREPMPKLLAAALALELVHNFILIHDDLIDRSDMRRGAPTLPRRLEDWMVAKPAAGFRGSDLALVTGDLLYTLAMASLMNVTAPAEQKVQAMTDLADAALVTGRGALLEMRAAQTELSHLTPEAIEHIYALKTGRYTFTLPLRLAAIFSGTDASDRFGDIGQSAGIAYQLKNDRDELRIWLEGGRLPDDLRDKRRTWPLVHAWHATDSGGRALIAGEAGEELKDIFRAIGTLEALDRAIARHAAQALVGVTAPELRDFLADALR